MKYLYLLPFFFFSFCGIGAQEVTGSASHGDTLMQYDGMPFHDGRRMESPAPRTPETDADPSGDGAPLKSGTWDFSLGTSYSYMNGFGSGATLYAAPFYTFPLNNRWSLHGGMVASHTAGFPGFTGSGNPPGLEGFGNGSASFSTLSFFGAASYRLNDRLVLHGAGVKTVATYPERPPLLFNPLTPAATDHLTVGATYRLGKNITIGASFRMENRRGFHGMDRYYGSPFQSTPFGSPLYW